MGLAFSEGPIVYGTISAADSATLRGELHSAALEAGWSASATTGGYIYTLTSPQNLGCEVRIVDDGTPNQITVQFRSVGGALAGPEHVLGYASGREYRAWLNSCQIFVWQEDVYQDNVPDRTVAGGIPRVPNPAADPLSGSCGEAYGPDEDGEAWWGSGGHGTTFRNRWFLDSFGSCKFASCYNGVLLSSPTTYHTRLSAPRLVPISFGEGLAVEYMPYGQRPHVRWSGGSEQPLLLDPLIAWGSSDPAMPARVRGQLWDALLISQKVEGDAEVTYTDSTDYYDDLAAGEPSPRPPVSLPFVNFSAHPNDGPSPAGNFYGSLALLLEQPAAGGGVGNVAY